MQIVPLVNVRKIWHGTFGQENARLPFGWEGQVDACIQQGLNGLACQAYGGDDR